MSKALSSAEPGRVRPLLIGGLAVLLAGMASGLAFGGWISHGTDILNALWEAGLSWCL